MRIQQQLSPAKEALRRRFFDMVKGITDAVFVVVSAPKTTRPPERPVEKISKPGTHLNIVV